MAISNYLPKADLWTGVAIGVALLAAPVVIPMIGAALKPVLKAAIKGGYMLYEGGREIVAEVIEDVEDLAAEAMQEADAQLAVKATAEKAS